MKSEKVQQLSEKVRQLNATVAEDEQAGAAPPTIQEAEHVSSDVTVVTGQLLLGDSAIASSDSKFSMVKFAMDHFRQGEARCVCPACMSSAMD